jgi:hypothetical protein
VHLQKKIVKNAPILKVIKSVTHVVHLPEEGHQERIPSSEIIKIDTHVVHLLEIIKSVTHVVHLPEEGHQR